MKKRILTATTMMTAQTMGTIWQLLMSDPDSIVGWNDRGYIVALIWDYIEDNTEGFVIFGWSSDKKRAEAEHK
jgi:hypothetical protein